MNFPPGNLVGLLSNAHDADFVTHVMRGVLEALQSYHNRGKSYGQVRPDTIYLASDGRIRLADMRATIVATNIAAPESLSKYLPPEALAGQIFGDVGPSTDLYALGLVALELLVGQRFTGLFAGVANDPLGEDLAWMQWHSSPDDRLPPTSSLAPTAPAELTSTIDRMLAKRVADRIKTASDALAALSGAAVPTPAAQPAIAPQSPAPKAEPPQPKAQQSEPPRPAPSVAPDFSKTIVEVQKTTPAVQQTTPEAGARGRDVQPPPRSGNDAAPADPRRTKPAVTSTVHEEKAAPVARSDADMRRSDARPEQVAATQVFKTPIEVEAVDRQPSGVRGTMMPDMDPPRAKAPDAKTPAPAVAVEIAPKAKPPRETPRSTPLASEYPGYQRTPGQKVLRVFDSPLGILLLCGCVIAGVAYLLFFAWPPEVNRLLAVETQPPGATVYIDGEKQKEPSPISVRLPLGKHSIKTTLAEYEDAAQDITVTESEQSPAVKIPLVKIQTDRPLQIATIPENAIIYLDGSPTPLDSGSAVVALGKHTLKIEAPGFISSEETIDVVPGAGSFERKFSLEAVKKKIETVAIQVDPPTAEVRAGGKPAPVTPQGLAETKVEEGSTLELSVTADGYAPSKRTLTYDAIQSDRFKIVVELDPILKVEPADATVLVGDKPLKLVSGEAVIPRSTNFHIVASAKGHGSLDRTFTFDALKLQQFRIKLPRGPQPPDSVELVSGGRYKHKMLAEVGAPLELVTIDAGEFVYGAADDLRSGELEQRRMTIAAPYLMATTEVSVKQYAVFAAKAGETIAGTTWKSGVDADSMLPVTNVTHAQAKAFCAWAGGKLPTEEQWERAARGAKGRLYPWAETDGPSSERCVMRFGKDAPTAPVAVDKQLTGATPEGIQHMLGNVEEWCDSIYKAGHDDLGAEPTPGIDLWPTIRGGSFKSLGDETRTTTRANHLPDKGAADIGFRMVMPFVVGE